MYFTDTSRFARQFIYNITEEDLIQYCKLHQRNSGKQNYEQRLQPTGYRYLQAKTFFNRRFNICEILRCWSSITLISEDKRAEIFVFSKSELGTENLGYCISQAVRSKA